MKAEHDVLVLADISGFTAFVTAVELEHGPQIIGALLEAVMRRLASPLEIREIEGDAVFALGPDGALLPPVQLLDVFDPAFGAFKETQRRLAADESCSCGACRSLERLNLKIVAHYGRFLRHAVGGRAQVAGVDVILAHQRPHPGGGVQGRDPRRPESLLAVPGSSGASPASAALAVKLRLGHVARVPNSAWIAEGAAEHRGDESHASRSMYRLTATCSLRVP